MKRRIRLFSAIIALFTCAAHSATFTVSTDTEGGIQGVIDGASEGDVIEVAAGLYEISSPISITKAITLSGAGRDETIVRLVSGIKNVRVLEMTNGAVGAVVEGLTFSGGDFNSSSKWGLCALVESGTVQDCTFSDSYISAWGGGGGVFLKGTNSKLLRSVIKNCSQNQSATSVALRLDGGAVADSCLITENVCKYRDNTPNIVSVINSKMRNCTITKNVSICNTAPGVAIEGNNAIIENCILWGNNYRVQNEISGSMSKVVNSVTTDPKFVDFHGGDYRLAIDSPAIDFGKEGTVSATEFDLDGNARLIRGRIDAGCYEYVHMENLAASFNSDKVQLLSGDACVFTPVVTNAVGALSYEWTFSGGIGTFTEESPSIVFPTGGEYTAVLRVSDGTAQVTCQKSLVVAPKIVYVNPNATNPQGMFESPETATSSVEDAVAAAMDGSTILLSSGEHIVNWDGSTHFQIFIEKAVTIRGAGANPSNTIVKSTGKSQKRTLFTLTDANAVIENMMITGAYDGNQDGGGAIRLIGGGGTVTNCIIQGNYSTAWNSQGSGVRMTTGLVTHCVISNNTGSCFNNNEKSGGCGVWMSGGVCANSLICDNVGVAENNQTGPGGAVNISGGTLINCTIANNRQTLCSGVYARGGSVINCVIAGNTSFNAAENTAQYQVWAGNSSLFFNCAGDNGIVINGSCRAEATTFGYADFAKGDYRLGIGSCAIDLGQDNLLAGEKDLALTERKLGSSIDAGCYELDISSLPLSASISSDITTGIAPLTVNYVVTTVGEKGVLSYEWDLDGDGVFEETTSVPAFSAKYFTPASFLPSVRVTDGETGDTAEKSLSGSIAIYPKRIFVKVENEGVAFPYDVPEKAFTSIQDAIDFAIDGMEIVVYPGNYHVGGDATKKGEFSVNKGIVVRSLNNDPSTTIVTAGGNVSYGVARRAFSLNHPKAFVSGFTMENGVIDTGEGACASINTAGGTIENCVIRGGIAKGWTASGGALIIQSENGLVSRCVITNNSTMLREQGTKLLGGAVVVKSGRIENSLIANNKGLGYSNENYFSQAAGVVLSGGKMVNCTISGNKGIKSGGVTIMGGEMINCIVVGNTVDHEAVTLAGGEFHSAINVNVGNNAALEAAALAEVRYTAVDESDLISRLGEGSVYSTSENVRFADFAGKNYRLKSKSPCRNKGLITDGLEERSDLDGQPRVYGHNIDMGCYELQRGHGALLMLK